MSDKMDLENRKSNLSDAKRALLASRIRGQAVEVPVQRGIPRREQADRIPLSFAQQRLWFLYQLEPDSAYYNLPTAVRLKGTVQLELLERAINAVVKRHEALRTRFASVDGEPVQVIDPSLHVPLQVLDLTAVPEEEREAAAERVAFEEAGRFFNLETGPLIRVVVARLAEQDHLLVLNLHHIVTDGWSSAILVAEMAAYYDAFRTGAPLLLPELPIQYADYAVWQRAYLTGEVQESQLSYWKQQLGGHLPVLQLLTDRPRPAVQTFNGDSYSFTVEKPLTDRLKQLAAGADASMFMVLFAAFETLLYRYTGQEDLLVGTPIAGRNRMEVEGLIGFFANTLVLRTAMSDRLTFRELVEQVRQVSLDAYAHQDFPFERLVEELQPERNMAQTPLFQVMFIHQKNQWIPIERDGLTIASMEVNSKTSKFDLSLFMLESPDEVVGVFEYNTDLFDRTTIERMKDQLVRMLEAVAENPDLTLAEIPLLGEAEQHRVLVEWNETAQAYREDVCVHELFEAQSERTPDATAVVYQGQELTYAELNSRANQLAWRLRELGVGPDVCVGISMERSLEMVVAVLATLKASGAYVSLDPNYPEERLAFMLEDTQVSVLITQEALAGKFEGKVGVANATSRSTADANVGVSANTNTSLSHVLILDRDWHEIATQNTSILPHVATPEHLAYVLYTSGSTGKPKGVLMPHRVLTNLLQWQFESTVLKHGARTMQFASLNFDVSFQEMFTTLCSGGALYIVEEDVRRDPVRLLHFLDEQAVERMFLPFVAFQQLAEVASSASQVPQALREIITAGEQLQISRQIVKWLEQTPGVVVHNQYGPSETHVATAYTLTGSPKKWPTLPPIGRPIANARIYLLDANMQPVPIGVPGEMYIGSIVARGYLNRPELTEERFLPNPFLDRVKNQQANMYKTGDLARYLPDGTIEFLGRADHQVKIRGYRVELGEVEAVLTQHPSVREAAVIAREDVPGDKRLVAYLVVDTMAIPETAQLRRFLTARLPEYMVPSAYVHLEKLPLTPSGKLDRRSLPEPERDTEELKRSYVAPRTPVEEVLASIWGEVLHLDQVGILENFFELGGHSLLATQVISRIKSSFDVEIPLRKLFENPTVSALALAIEQSSDMRPAPPILPVPRAQMLPLSFAQERLWFFEQLQPGTATYNLPNIIRLNGRLDVEVLQRSANEIVKRHEAVRTTFDVIDGQPVQVIKPEMEIPLRLIDLQALPEPKREAEALRLATEEAMRPFDLLKDDLVRGLLLRLDETEHVLVLNMHHICSDGWSLGVMVKELVALYSAFLYNHPPSLRPLPVQYADFSHWQRNWLQGEVLEEQMSYWKQQLGGDLPLLQLPSDRPRPAVRSFRGDGESFTLSGKMTQDLQRLAQREGVTLYMLLLAAFQTLMHRLSGQEDILVGSPIAGRNRGEIEGLIGFFVNTLVLRSDFTGDPTFQDLLKQVRKTTLDAYAHQDLPFEKLVEELQPDRSLSVSPLFQVLFVLQNAPQGSLDLPGLSISPWNIGTGTAKFDLSIYMAEEDSGLAGVLEYNSDLFDRATVVRFLELFKTLLAGICADSQQAVSQMQLLPEAEREQVVVRWNATQTDYPRDAAIHHLFEQQAQRTPDAVALVFGEREMTYRELNERANRVASHLQKIGVGPGLPVGLCVERSPEMVVGLLAILKAGGAYVPLDPNYPLERLVHMMSDTAITVLLAHQHLLGSLPSHEAEVVLLDAELAPFADENVANPQVEVEGDYPAYVMYTSGSTGMPKGVVIPHRGVVRLVKGTDYIDFSAEQVLLQFAPISFDASTLEIWGSLLNGAKLVLAPAGKLSLEELGDVLLRHEVTTLWLTAGLFHQMVEGHWQSLRTVKQLLAGGDVLSPAHVRKVLQQLPGITVINGYGPTESTTFTTCYAMREDAQALATVPIGRPIANTQVYVLDANRQPVPIGVSGELYIGGDGLALGYLNQPELTDERFVPSPFSEELLYKTGDLVRYLADGTLEFLGRLDNQVKIRGFRIELGEIETVLGQHPALQETYVMVREDVPGDKRLVAYLVPHAGMEVESKELRAFLKERLPDYMIPTAFINLEQLPLTQNGKVDRRALPAPNETLWETSGTYVEPRTELEQKIADIWADVLRVPRVGGDDHFFELGGHSLLATQVVSRLNVALGVEMPLRMLFEHPTVGQLAVALQTLMQAGQPSSLAPIRAASNAKQLPLSYSQQRLWLVDQLLPGSVAYNVPSAIRLEGTLHLPALQQSLNEVIRRHEALRTVFAVSEGEPIQVICELEGVQLLAVDLQTFSPEQREEMALQQVHEESNQPFDLKSGPLIRFRLLQMGEQDHILVINMHHIVSDGWSMGVLIEEMTTLYTAFVNGLPSPLPELTIQYADYAIWQRDWLQGDVLDAQLSYWKQQLGGELPMLQLPLDRPRPAVATQKGATVTWTIRPELTESLHRLAKQMEVTPFMALLATYQLLLSRYSGQDDICVGTPIAGRNRQETEALIGFFVNTLVMRTDLSGDLTGAELLARVREVALGAYAHQDVPFEKLVEVLQPERDLSRSPLFQAMFSLQNRTQTEIRLPDLTVRPVDAQNHTVKFDLHLTVTQQEQGLDLNLQYNRDLFEERTMQQMIRHFETLLEQMVHHPQQRLTDLQMLTEEELAQLAAWNETAGKETAGETEQALCLHHWFEQQVICTPDAVAVVYEGTQLSYGELNRLANRLAHNLQRLGVEAETRVALLAERSAEMIVGLLGILKSGGAYVPIDPTFPSERIAYILEDAQTPVIVTQPQFLPQLSKSTAQVILLDDLKLEHEPSTPTDMSEENPHADVCESNAAYVIYTSGSTGSSKGVVVEHRNIVNYVRGILEELDLDDMMSYATVSTLAADLGNTMLFPALCTGGTLHVIAQYRLADVEAMADYFAAHPIDCLKIVPSHLSALLSGEPARILPRKLLILGGEPLRTDLVARLTEAAPDLHIYNHYGPTETTVGVLTNKVDLKQSSLHTATVPIGRPIPNVQAHVLDRCMQPVAVGVVGELYVGGVAVTRGYLNRPELTAERYLPNPYAAATEPQSRLYKTGDLVRRHADGRLEFMGRTDDQVKIRGYRIELGEIESVLAGHPAIRESYLLVSGEESDKRLIAYLVPDRSETPDSADLRRFLRGKLPDFMIPSAFVMMEALPLNANGKVDRRALPLPDASRQVESEYIAPRTEMEEQLAALWQEVLGVERVGVFDNFFELGGHSLLATRVITQVQAKFGVEVSLRSLFQEPTIKRLAEVVAELQAKQLAEAVPAGGPAKPELKALSRASYRVRK